MTDCVLLGDRGYLSESIQLDLFQTVKIKLEIPNRANQKDYKPQSYIFRKTRILTKITALTLVQYTNKFIFDRPINNIKNQFI